MENLSDKIAEVRQLYLDTLKDWPHDDGSEDRTVRARRGAPAKKTRRGAKKARQEGAGEEGCGQEGTGQEGAGEEGTTKRRGQEGTAVTAADPMATFSTTDDALVLASVSSPAERELLSDWLQQPTA